MKNYLRGFVFFIVMLFCSPCISQGISGTITFTNGGTQAFQNITGIKMSATGATSGSNTSYNTSSIDAHYNNSTREIPFDKLKKITVSNRIGRDWSTCFLSCSVEIVTSTNVEFLSQNMLFGDVRVLIMDELTGEKREVKFNFLNDGIESISFNN